MISCTGAGQSENPTDDCAGGTIYNRSLTFATFIKVARVMIVERHLNLFNILESMV
jgi:hypothetical protein